MFVKYKALALSQIKKFSLRRVESVRRKKEIVRCPVDDLFLAKGGIVLCGLHKDDNGEIQNVSVERVVYMGTQSLAVFCSKKYERKRNYCHI